MNIIKKIVLLIAIILALIINDTALGAAAAGSGSDDIMISFRFYEGHRGAEEEKSRGRVVTTYHLKPMFVGNMLTQHNLRQEKNELKRVFNLKSVTLMSRTRWGWQKSRKDKRMQVVVLNGHEFQVDLELTGKTDGFKLVVTEKGKTGNKALLDTDISLPQKKTAVFGFEDSLNKPFFLSLYRQKDEDVILTEPLALEVSEHPVIKKYVSPEFPVVARKAGVHDKVSMQVTLDANGKVWDLKFISGHPFFKKAAEDAVKQWQYHPYILNGVAKPVIFTITVDFTKPGAIPKKKAANMFIWPTKGYFSSGFGWRKHPFTGKKALHKGIDIATHMGKNVLAAADGTVEIAQFRKIYGNLVIIRHSGGYSTLYSQLKSYTVKKGDTVKQGQLIGYVGSSGRSTAPHLHWEVRLNEKPVNPMDIVD